MKAARFLIVLTNLAFVTGCLTSSPSSSSDGGSGSNPNAPAITIAAPAASTTTASTISLSGTCTTSVSTVDISGASPATTTCSGGTFSVTITLSGANGNKTVTVSQSNSDGTGSNSRIFILNNAVPSVAISSPAASTITASIITLAGTCTSSVATVDISGATPTSTACSGGTFSQAITLSGGDGTKNVVVSQTDGNGTGSDNRNFILDSTAPSSTSISINSGASYTNSTSATLTLAASDANSGIQMYVTNTAGCVSGGTYESFNSSKSWTLGQTNGTATVYAKFKDSVGNESSCISDTIIHDSVAPSIAYSSPADGSYGSTGLTVGGSCEDGLTITLNGSGITATTATCSSGTFSKAVTFTAGEGNKQVTISQTDLVSNTTSDTRTFVRDNTNPGDVTFAAPAADGSTSASTYNFQWSAATDNYSVASYKIDIFQNNNCSGSASSTVSSQAGTSYNLTLNSGYNTVKVYARDGAGNLSTGVCSHYVQYIPPSIILYHANASTGNIGNRATADARCVTNKPGGVTQANVRAFISYSTSQIDDFPTVYSVPTNAAIKTSGGTQISANWNDFKSSAASGGLSATLQASGIGFAGNFWSGTDGTFQYGFNCNDWTSNSAAVEGFYGSSTATYPWIYVSTSNMWCNNSRYLLCIAFD